ncbi:MAG: acetate--CoA ligase family protein [Hyphomicrobiaceae bacterium]|nr:acetate--CoA ligase family protein [Hyphomicrobiaceae bacterium]
MADLSRLLRPRSIAVFGAGWAREVIRQSKRMGFAGAIWPVHPDKAEIEGLAAFPSIAALPAAPDASFVGVNRHATIDVIAELAARGAGGAVCFASGFAETGGEGDGLQQALIDAAGAMPVLGPNCYGFINALDGALLWPDLHGCDRVERGVAFLTQSSNIAINLTMGRRALPIAYVVCLGNQAVTGLPEAIAGMADDPRVSVIALHIEGIADPAAFAAAAQRARAAGKHLIALKVGASAGAQAMTLSHTASLAGSAGVGSAFLKKLGIAEVSTIPELLETAKFLHVGGPIGASGLLTLSCSGGEASIMADAAARAGVPMPPLRDADVARVRPTVNPLVTVSNPFDYHTFDWGKPERLQPTFAAVMAGPQAVTALVLDFPKAELGDATGWDQALDAFCAAARATSSAAAVIATVPECLPEAAGHSLAARGVAPLMGVAEAMTAFRVAAEAKSAPPAFAPLPPPLPGEAMLLDEAAGKALLAGFGVAVPEGRLCASEAETVAAVAALGPCAVKAVSTRIAHKTEAGAVMLNVADAAGARAAFARLSRLSNTILVERMVAGPVAELIVGASRDPALGLHLVVGAGGVLAELLRDSVILIPPVSRDEIRVAIAGLRIAPLLAGWRGGKPADVEALVETIDAVGRFVAAHAADLVELDINPLIVTADGAFAADALVRLARR